MAAPTEKNVASHDPTFDEDSSLYNDALALNVEEKKLPTNEEKNDTKHSREKSRQRAKNGSKQKSKSTKGQSQIQHDQSSEADRDSENGAKSKHGHLSEKVQKHELSKMGSDKKTDAHSESVKITPLMELNVTPQKPHHKIREVQSRRAQEQDDFQSELIESYNRIKVRQRKEIRNVFTRMEGRALLLKLNWLTFINV